MQSNIHDAKTHFSQLIERALAGEEVIIAKAGKPILRLVPVGSGQLRRAFGIDQGKFTIPDDFDAPDPELIALVEGGSV